jgi:hypothetical protein
MHQLEPLSELLQGEVALEGGRWLAHVDCVMRSVPRRRQRPRRVSVS